MVERPFAHHDPHGRPPIPDGDRYRSPRRPAPPPPRRRMLPGWIVAGIALAVMVAGIAGWLS